MADQVPAGAEAQRETPPHQEPELRRLERRIDQGDPLWPAQLAVGIAIALHLTLSDKLVIGPKWLIPAVEGLLFVTLVRVSPRRASGIHGNSRRGLLWLVLGLVTLTYLVSLG